MTSRAERRPRRWLIATGLALVAALTLIAVFSRSKPSRASSDETALRAELEGLRGEVAALRSGQAAAVASMGRALGAAVLKEPPAAGEERPRPEAKPGTQPAAKKVSADSIAAQISTGLQHETRDTSWAARAEDQLRSGFRMEALKDTTLGAVECRSTMCRMELTHRDRDAQDRFSQSVQQLPMFQNTEYFAHGQDREWKRYVLYLARGGHTLPRLEP